MKKILGSINIFLLILIYNIGISQNSGYPVAHKGNQTDNYFGTMVADPYRWLEDDNSRETKNWTMEENALTNEFLGKISFRDKIKARLTELWNFERMSPLYKKANSYFSFYNNGLQNQSVLCIQKTPESARIPLVDANSFSVDGTTAISGWSVSKDGKYLAYSLSKAGSDWNEIQVLEIATKAKLMDKIEWVKFSGIAWYKNGFYYSRYDAPEAEKQFTNKNTGHKVFYHQLNTSQAKDKLIFSDKDHPNYNFNLSVSEDERFMLLSGSESTSGNSLWIRRTGSDTGNAWKRIAVAMDNDLDFAGNVGNLVYVITNGSAPNKKLIKFDFDRFSQNNYDSIVPEQKDLMQGVHLAGGYILVNYLHNASSLLKIYNLNGRYLFDVPLDGLYQINEISARDQDSIVFFTCSSFTTPPSVKKYNISSNTLQDYFTPKTSFKYKDYVTDQVFFSSKDGTSIPMFITHKKGMVPNGKAPCFVFGYGGFNISYSPEFRADRALFLEAGGYYCVPNIRGGGEFGEDWHKQGTKCSKQNVFDDFIAACEYLISNNYTTSSHLAIHGRSNGGLLIGAVVTQRPDLAAVALPTVGVLDMLRFHLFTIGRSWTSDYGCSENEAEFRCLYKYSPLHSAKKANYPATLILTGDHDDRVVPAHSFKFAATLQEQQKGKQPVLIRIDQNAGHGSGKPTAKQISEFADMWSFVFFNLGMEYN